MVVYGLTHCPVCHESYGGDIICKHCEAEKERTKQEKLDILLSLDINEIEYLVEVAKKGGKQVKNQKIKDKIEQLKQELEE